MNYHVRVRHSPLAELMSYLHMVSSPDHHHGQQDAIERFSREVEDGLQDRVRFWSPLWIRFRFRALLPIATAPYRTLTAELESLEQIDLHDFVLMAAEAIAGGRGLTAGLGAFSRDLVPDPTEPHEPGTERVKSAHLRITGYEEFLHMCRVRSREREDLAKFLVSEPMRFREALVTFLRQITDTAVGHELEQAAHECQRVVARLERRFIAGPVVQALASVTGIAHHLPESNRITFDKSQQANVTIDHPDIIVVVSTYTDPHVVVKFDAHYGGTRTPLVIQVPAEGKQISETRLQHTLDIMAVLAEPRRTELCRHLGNEYISTQELSERLDMAPSQVSRHLKRLKDVDLVRTRRDGKQVKYFLAIDRVAEIGRQYLDRLLM